MSVRPTRVELRYGTGRLDIEVPASTDVDVFAPRSASERPTADDFLAELTEAGGRDWFTDKHPLIIVNDGYRSTPTATVLTWLDRFDPTLLDRADFLIATGTHEPPTDEHRHSVFGSCLQRIRSRLAFHDCREKSQLILLGNDSFGGEVWLNRIAAKRDRVIAISSVEPHYFAGFTGGRKSLFPGLTDQATIERNHNLANSLEACPMRLAGNPVAEHLEQLMKLLAGKQLFGIQTVLDADNHIAGAFCGPLSDAFRRGTECAAQIFAHHAEVPYDIVIAEMQPPLDANLYQLQKALENCQTAVADGGTIVLLSACLQGIGSDHFFELARDWDRESNSPCDGVLRFGSHKLSRVISIGRRCRVLLHCELDPREVRQVFYEPLDKVADFVFISLSQMPGSRLAVVRDAGNTVLTI